MYSTFITKGGKRKSRSDTPIKADSRAAYNLYVIYMFAVNNRKISSGQCLQNTWILAVRERLTSMLALDSLWMVKIRLKFQRRHKPTHKICLQ